MKKILLTLLLLFLALFADITQYFPKLDGRVVDTANILSNSAKEQLTTLLKEHEDKTSNQIVVVTLKSLNGYEIEEFSYQLGRYWGIGQKDLNNGVLLVISMEEKKLRIEVGYGLEGALTDKISYEIINYTLKPKFRQERYEEGISNAVEEIIQAIKGEYTAKTKVKDEDKEQNDFIAFFFFTIIFISIFLSGVSAKLKNQFLYKVSKSSIFSSFFAFFTFVMAQSFTSFYTIIALAIFLIVFIFNFLSMKNVDFNKIKKYSNNSSNTSAQGFGGFGSSSSGGFSSGGGFSGGGGGFGGGGASGGW
jgi:uncharacterized protein